MALNLTGAIVTGITVLVVIVARFSEGAWITLIAIPALLFTMYGVHRPYETVRREVDLSRPLQTNLPSPPILVITMQSWTRVNEQALRAAMAISRDIKVVHVAEDGKPNDFCEKWREYIENPASGADLPVPELVQHYPRVVWPTARGEARKSR